MVVALCDAGKHSGCKRPRRFHVSQTSFSVHSVSDFGDMVTFECNILLCYALCYTGAYVAALSQPSLLEYGYSFL